MLGKTIKLFLIDGEPNGRITCELSNWTGKAYKIPRIKVKECGDRPELKNPGVYLLFGKQEEGQNIVYIGEGEDVFKRLGQQLNRKDFWNEVIVFISKDENLNKAHIKYLENRLYNIAHTLDRYSITNTTVPTKPSISEPDRAEMEAFINNVKILTNTLGHKVFESKREKHTEEQKKERIFYINAARGADASGEPTADGFVIFKGSKIATTEVDSIPDYVQRLRKKLLDKKEVRIENGKYIMNKDYVASSPSSAAAIVMG